MSRTVLTVTVDADGATLVSFPDGSRLELVDAASTGMAAIVQFLEEILLHDKLPAEMIDRTCNGLMDLAREKFVKGGRIVDGAIRTRGKR
jgi:hypothetical protein